MLDNDTERDAARAGTPRADVALAELRRLRRRVSQQDRAMVQLTEAMLTLRQGALALREENRELRLRLEQRSQRS